MEEINYRLLFSVSGYAPGFHRSISEGSGMLFNGYAALSGPNDVKRLDVRATIANPSGDWMVRKYRIRSSISVWILLDHSGSMGFSGKREKPSVTMQLIKAIAFSALRTGDRIGIIAVGEEVTPRIHLPATHSRSLIESTLSRLSEQPPHGGATSLADLQKFLPSKSSLVFLISDFYLNINIIAKTLMSMLHHHVIPVVIRDEIENSTPTKFGLLGVKDMESGQVRRVFMRPSYRAKWEQSRREHRGQLRRCFLQRGVRPFFLERELDIERINRYFQGEDCEDC